MLVSIVAATRRPHFLANLAGSIRRQRHAFVEPILVAHGFEVASLEPGLRALVDSTFDRVLERPADEPLGTCLNHGVAASRGEAIAKFDDDDIYGAAYLEEAVAALKATGAAVVGKTEIWIYFARDRTLTLMYPGTGKTFQDVVTGPTMCIRRSVAESLPFEPVGISEDTLFHAAVRARGLEIFSTSRRNFLHRRFEPSHHTAFESEGILRERSVAVRLGILDDGTDALLRMIES